MKLQLRSGGWVEVGWEGVASPSGLVTPRVVLRVRIDDDPRAGTEVFLDPGEVEAIAHALRWQQEQLDLPSPDAMRQQRHR